MEEITTYPLDTPEEVEARRSNLRENVKGWKARHRDLTLDMRARDRELRIAEKGELRVAKLAKPEFRNGNGQLVRLDKASARKNDILNQLADIVAERETLEIQIEEAEMELATLPVEKPKEEDSDVAIEADTLA